jgi:multidrug efflux system outer membrane protein
MLTQYRETLRALIGADAQSMPAIHPVALPALQELPPSLSFELLARRPDLQALRGYVRLPEPGRCGESGLLSPF